MKQGRGEGGRKPIIGVDHPDHLRERVDDRSPVGGRKGDGAAVRRVRQPAEPQQGRAGGERPSSPSLSRASTAR